MIEVANLSKVYAGAGRTFIKALDNVSTTCKTGAFYALLGENGAGKTTFFRMLMGLLRPTSGQVSVCGYDPGSDPGNVRANAGYLSAATRLYGRLSPNEILTYFGRLSGVHPTELAARIDSLSESLGLGDFRHRPCAELSTGMRQKVSMARALVHDPKCLFLDEPFDAVDVLARKAMQNLLLEHKAKQKTIICSAHRTEDIESMCDYVLIFSRGKLVADATLSQLQQTYNAERLDDIFQKLITASKA